MSRAWNNLYLTGFMGVGKTVIGGLLADALGLAFFDSDRHVEVHTKLSIAELFAKEGERGFRLREEQAVRFLSEKKDSVVSLGGGALGRPESRKCILKTGLLIYLKADMETLLKRLNPAARPLLAGLKGEALTQRVQTLYAQRMAQYELAQIEIDTSGITPQEVVARIQNEVTAWKA